MSFEIRQKARQRTIEQVMFASKLLAVFYLSLHAAVTALAYKLAGMGEAFLTLITLGAGDLYWAVTWAREDGLGTIAAIAGLAAVTCFASWALRPAFERWARSLTAEMLSDTAGEIGRIVDARDGQDAGAEQGPGESRPSD